MHITKGALFADQCVGSLLPCFLEQAFIWTPKTLWIFAFDCWTCHVLPSVHFLLYKVWMLVTVAPAVSFLDDSSLFLKLLFVASIKRLRIQWSYLNIKLLYITEKNLYIYNNFDSALKRYYLPQEFKNCLRVTTQEIQLHWEYSNFLLKAYKWRQCFVLCLAKAVS